MKKVCCLILMLSVAALCFAETESWGTIGFQYGNYWEKADIPQGTVKTWIGAPGVVFNAYTFFNKKNIGLFIADSFLFPTNSLATVSNYTKKDAVKEWDFIFLFQFGIGPAFKYAITDKLDLHTGVGLNISMMSANREKYTYVQAYPMPVHLKMRYFSLGLGIMGDIGLKYDITNIIYLNIGTKLAFDFSYYTKISSNIDEFNNSKWVSNYLGIYTSPYIGVGIQLPF